MHFFRCSALLSLNQKMLKIPRLSFFSVSTWKSAFQLHRAEFVTLTINGIEVEINKQFGSKLSNFIQDIIFTRIKTCSICFITQYGQVQ